VLGQKLRRTVAADLGLLVDLEGGHGPRPDFFSQTWPRSDFTVLRSS
jgi:hypothetical protein